MLQNMRDSAKSWTIKVILIFVALSFVIWGVGGKDKEEGGVVAVVQGEEIRYTEFKRVYNNMYDFLKKNNNMDVNNEFWEKIIRRNALNGIILKKLVTNMANEMGIVVSDKELADRIQADTNFFKDGKFDRALYLQALRVNRLKPADFEEDYRNNVKQEKLEKSLTSTLFATKQEVLDAYIYENEKIDINYIAISPTFFEKKVEVKDEELTKYFEASKEKFRRDEKITAEILVAEPSAFVTGITLDEQRVADYYKMNQDKFTVPKRIKASHILFRESGTSAQTDSQARSKAESVLKEIKSGKDFSELAKKHSDDFSAQSGGDLGFFSKGRMVKEFEDVAFSLKEGEVSEIVKTEFGYHIIKVEKIEEERVKPLAIARGEIEAKFKRDDSVNLAKNALEKILKEEDPKGAGLKGFPAKYPRLKTAEYILSKKDSLHPILSANAFSLKIGEVGGVIEEGNAYYILRPLSMKESFIPNLNEVRGEVELSFRAAEGEKLAEKEMAQLVAKIKAGEDITSSLSGEIFFEKGTSGFIGRKGFIPAIGRDSKDVIEKSFSAPKGEFLTFKGADKSYIFNVQSTLTIDMETFKKDEESFTKQFIENKRNKFLTNWRDNLLKKATEDGKVKISEGFSV